VDPSAEAPTLTWAKAPIRPKKKTFYLFSENIGTSITLSTIQAGFVAKSLDHELKTLETSDVDTVPDILRDTGVNGGIIESRFGLDLLEEAEYVSDEAEQIGAVTVITKDEFGDLHGDNTIWKAIHRLLIDAKANEEGNLALILGMDNFATAAACALQHLGIPTVIWDAENSGRTAIACSTFGCEHASDASQLDLSLFSILVTCHAPFPLTEASLHSNLLIIDPIYDSESPMAALARSHNCRYISGLEVQFNSNLLAFQAFVSPIGLPTAVEAPKKDMAKALFESLPEQLKSNPPEFISRNL
jgi:shikimate 5-dehydrogenase